MIFLVTTNYNTGRLRLVVCLNYNCTSKRIYPDFEFGSTQYPSNSVTGDNGRIAFGSDGLPIIAAITQDTSCSNSNTLHIIHCLSLDCSSYTINTVASCIAKNDDTLSIYTMDNGFPIVFYKQFILPPVGLESDVRTIIVVYIWETT